MDDALAEERVRDGDAGLVALVPEPPARGPSVAYFTSVFAFHLTSFGSTSSSSLV